MNPSQKKDAVFLGKVGAVLGVLLVGIIIGQMIQGILGKTQVRA